MTDRVSTNVLENGAVRYAIYNADGTLNRYEYITIADEPTEVGTALNKANILSDASANAINTATGTTPSTPAQAITLIGNNLNSLNLGNIRNSFYKSTIAFNARASLGTSAKDLLATNTASNDIISTTAGSGLITLKKDGIYMFSTRLERTDGNATVCTATVYDITNSTSLQTIGRIPNNTTAGACTSTFLISGTSDTKKISIRLVMSSGTGDVSASSALYVYYLG